MMKEYRKEVFLNIEITIDEGVDCIVGMYVIGDIIKNSQIESGIFVKARDSLLLFEIHASPELIAYDLSILKDFLRGKTFALYEGAQILIQDEESNFAVRYDPIPAGVFDIIFSTEVVT